MCVGTITIAAIIRLLNFILLNRIIGRIYNHFFFLLRVPERSIELILIHMVLQLNIWFFFFVPLSWICVWSVLPEQWTFTSITSFPCDFSTNRPSCQRFPINRHPEICWHGDLKRPNDLKSRFLEGSQQPRQAGRQASSVLYLKEEAEKKWQTRIIDRWNMTPCVPQRYEPGIIN